VQEIHFTSYEGKEKLIKDYAERETAGAQQQAEDTNDKIQLEPAEKEIAENTELMTGESKKTFPAITAAMRAILSVLSTSYNAEDEDNEQTEQS
jgi:hypothetical protein